MKIHVVNEGDEHIQGYEKVEVSNGQVQLGKYADNECEFIMASDCLDLLDYNSAKDFMLQARQKLRLGGTLLVGGADLRMLARSVVMEAVSIEEANQLIFSKRSLIDTTTVAKLVTDLGLSILSTRISGLHYEIEASRQIPSN